MKMDGKMIWVGLVLCVIACPPRTKNPGLVGGKGGHGEADNREFKIYIYTPDANHPEVCYADLAAVTVWSTHHQRVRWISDDGQTPYTVDFTAGVNNPPPGTPFVDQGKPKASFAVPGDTSGVGSGVPTGHGYYAYAIKNAKNTTCKDASDPGVHINP